MFQGMRRCRGRAGLAAVVAAVLGLLPAVVPGSEATGRLAMPAAASAPVSRIIVGLRAPATAIESPGDGRVKALAWRSGLELRRHQAIGPALQLVELDRPLAGSELAELLAQLRADDAVAFAEPDSRVRRHAVPNDPLYAGQWYLQGSQPAATHVEAAWDVSTGAADIVVAVLDTGVRFDHPDLLRMGQGGRLLPGYDFVSADVGGGFLGANDGDGWDSDPSDPGDWISASDAQLPLFAGCTVEDSSWHGTRVAGLIGARTNNVTGIAGATWDSWILPVRVLGKCSGSNADILQAMRWAAGLHVDGVPDNPYPARVLNLSLGAAGSCPQGYQAVIAELDALGVVVVASAGNSGAPVEFPANCPGAMAVAGLRHVGTKVGYSNLGREVAVAAPAGNCVNLTGPCLFALDTTIDQGTTTPLGPGYSSPLNPSIGTSFSAPQVSGIAALMLGVNGSLGTSRLIARLRASARPFPAPDAGIPLCHVPTGASDIQELECGCTTSTCGAGMVDAPAALAEALRPIATATATPSATHPGEAVALAATASLPANGRSIVAYSWTTLSGAADISPADTSVATLRATASGPVTVRLTITDDQGATDSSDLVVTVNPPPGSGGGGGGSVGWAGLLALGLAALRRQAAAGLLRTWRCPMGLRVPGGCRDSGCSRR
ncbi:GlyGly-CTERM sorting domain-containing protein [Gammaproteobacteria bacterium PRO2]|nr:GlyGly-CTERM sorting domain-containing protein [Gammaproteobacteria bacterium]MDL1881611.1 GlyGly-CTERM sorting domain-containing protein [Gammaproteobacteria bacterium PRO2]